MKSDVSISRTIVKNASANVIRLAGSGIVALLLPPFLVRELPKDTYAAWALALQLALYVGYLDLGIQTTVSRFVAHEEELGNTVERDRTVSTAFAVLSAAALLGCVAIATLYWRFPALFRQMPPELYGTARVGLLFMGVTVSLGLPVNAIQAVFIGEQRNEIPAVLGVVNKALMAAFVVAVVLEHGTLAAMGAAFAFASLISYGASVVAFRCWASKVRIRFALVSKACLRKILDYSGSLMVWTVGMLMVSGLDLTIVGIFDYKATGYYAIAATLTTFLAQVQGAIFSALLPASAVLAARESSWQLGSLLVSSTRYGALILLTLSAPLVLASRFVIRHWAGPDYARHGAVILQILVIANVIRLCALPYATLLLGTGEHRRVIISPLAEGITNLAVSIAGAAFFGAVGVAVGTLVGAFVSLGMHLFYNIPRTLAIAINRRRLFREGFSRPLLCALPVVLLLGLRPFFPSVSDSMRTPLAVLAVIGTGLLIWRHGLIASDKEKLAHVVRLRTGTPEI